MRLQGDVIEWVQIVLMRWRLLEDLQVRIVLESIKQEHHVIAPQRLRRLILVAWSAQESSR